jgi:CRP-like cAMP-binding protein
LTLTAASSDRSRSLKKHELLARTGAAADSAIVLVAGLVKTHRQTPEGAEAVLGISGPGDLLGEIALVRDAVRSADASSLEPTEGIAIPASGLRAGGVVDVGLAINQETARLRLVVCDMDGLRVHAPRL